MRFKRFSPLVALVLMLAACDVESVPTTTAGTTADLANAAQVEAQAPVITELTAKPQGTNAVLLSVKATDPAGSQLTFAWSVDQGSLTARTGPSVLWTPPKVAGNYAATVEVTNTKGLKRSAVQRFSVSATGETTVAAPVLISSGAVASANGGTTTPGTTGPINGAPVNTVVGNGQFQVPSPLPFATPSVLAVGAAQPVATVAPGASGAPASPNPIPVATPTTSAAPASPIPVPVATPTLTPPPASPAASPTPTPRPPTPQPGVPVPPPSRWVQVPTTNIPTTASLRGLHFVPGAANTFNTGWAVGASGTVLKTTNSGANWSFSNTGVPGNAVLDRVVFTSDVAGTVTGGGFNEAGFAAGSIIVRSTDAGASWTDVSPPLFNAVVTELLAYNSQIVMVCDTNGRVLRSENANAPSAANVTWNLVETKPVDRPGDAARELRAGAIFPTDTTLAWFAGDAIYRLDTDHPTPAQRWVRVVQLGAGDDGIGTAVHMTSQNEIWVGTSTGKIFRSTDGGNNWFKLTKFFNREHNGAESPYLDNSGIMRLSFVDSNNGWALNATRAIDTRNATVTADTGRDLDNEADIDWKETPLPAGVNSFQIADRFVGANREFFGWAVGTNGVVLRYLPSL